MALKENIPGRRNDPRKTKAACLFSGTVTLTQITKAYRGKLMRDDAGEGIMARAYEITYSNVSFTQDYQGRTRRL